MRVASSAAGYLAVGLRFAVHPPSGIEERGDLLRPVEVGAVWPGRLELAFAGVHPDGVARDQLALDSDLEDLPEGVIVLLIEVAERGLSTRLQRRPVFLSM